MSAPSRLEILALTGIGEIRPGDDLAALLVASADSVAGGVVAGDVLVVSSKVISKAEGRSVPGDDRQAAIAGETVRVVAERLTPRGPARIVQGRSGLVMAAAGVDSSNVAPGTVLLLPVDSDASARALRARVLELTGVEVAIVVSDTLGRPWREGQVDLAIGAAGLAVTDDLRGATDAAGNLMEVTVRAVADELASAADLVKGKLGGVPAALVRGYGPLGDSPPGDGPGAAALARDPAADWFRLGHVEAVRSALGSPPGTPGLPLTPVPLDDVPSRLTRTLAVARAEADQSGPQATITDDDAFTLGATVQRVLVAAWAENLELTATREGTQVTIRASARS